RPMSGMINSEGNVFVFSADSYGTKGAEDIYVSLKNDNKWSEPINLGSVINTPFQELSPSLDQGGKTIYFASRAQRGMGSFDIFSSTRLDDTWKSWSAPVNLGSEINSDGRELYYRLSNKYHALFTTTHSSDGYGVIRAVTDSLQKPDTAIQIIPK